MGAARGRTGLRRRRKQGGRAAGRRLSGLPSDVRRARRDQPCLAGDQQGIYGYPADEGARIAIRVASDHLRGETSVELVLFVLFSADTREVFERALADLS